MISNSTSLRELQSLAAADDRTSTERVAREFEAMMLAEMLRAGSKPLFGGNPLDGGSAGRMAREQLFSQLALIASRGQDLGLARQLEADLTKGKTP